MPLFASEINRFVLLEKKIRHDRRRMRVYRERRVLGIKEFVGSRYSEDGTKGKRPIPLISKAIKILSRVIASENPRALVVPRHPTLKGGAKLLELGMNRLVDEINLNKTARAFLIDAFFGMGMMKGGLGEPGQKEMSGFLHQMGQPFADLVHFDDFTFDMDARDWENIRYASNREILSLKFTSPIGLLRRPTFGGR